MNTHRAIQPRPHQRGIVLVTSLLVMALLLLMALAFVELGTTESTVAGNAKSTAEAFYVAEGGVESLFADLRTLLAGTPAPAPAQLPSGANLAPGGSRAPANLSFAFDLTGAPPATGVAYVRPAAPYAYTTVLDSGAFRGLSARTTDFALRAQVTGPRGTRAAVQQVAQYLEIPLFQFGVFYGKGVDLEIAPGPAMTFNGRVHANSNIYVVANAGLTFDSYMTTAGKVYRSLKRDPAPPPRYNNPQLKDTGGTYQALNFDHDSTVNFTGPWTESAWKTQALASFGGLLLDQAMGVPQIIPPIPELFYNPSNPDVVAHQLIERAQPTDDAGMQAAKLYYQADLRIVDGVATDKNGTPVSLPGGVLTAKSFYDKREGKTLTVTEVDLAALQSSGQAPANGVLYVTDTGGNKAVRLVNGSQLPPGGLTVVTENPLYVQGDYNTVSKRPAAILADAITVLSTNWGPNNSDSKGTQDTNTRPARHTTVNAAFALGPAAESVEGQGNGQLENVIRFLEDWSVTDPSTGTQATITYRGSLIALWHSLKATGPWRCCGNTGTHYYQAPKRTWSYDTLFDTTLPPGTPRAISIVRARWQG